MDRLLYLPKLQPLESPGSFLLRASRGNGCLSLYHFFWPLNTHITNQTFYANFLNQPKKWKTLDKLLPQASYNAPYELINRKRQELRVKGISTHGSLLRLHNPVICPECADKNGYLDYRWDFVFITTCPIHNRYLLTECPHCHAPLRWNRAGILTCHCQKSLMDIQRESCNLSTSVQRLHRAFDEHNQDYIERFQSIFYAITQDVEFLLEKFDQVNQLAELTVEVMENNQSAITKMWERYYQPKINLSIHPRLACLNLLSSTNESTRRLAHTLLRHKYQSQPVQYQDLKLQDLTRRQASEALGISIHQVKNLTYLYMVGDKVVDDQKIDATKVNSLLHLFSKTNVATETTQSISHTLTRPSNKMTLSDIVDDVVAGKPVKAMDITQGILSANIKPRSVRLHKWDTFMTLKQAARDYGVSYEILRHAVKAGWVKRVEPEDRLGTTIYLTRTNLNRFFNQYSFSGQIASRLGVNNTNLAEKLMAFGAYPVSGPSIDGGVSYLFRNKEVKHVTADDIKNLKNYDTRTGRGAPNRNVRPKISGYTVKQAAKLLKVSESTVRRMVYQGELRRVEGKQRELRIDKSSVHINFGLKTADFSLPLSKYAPHLGMTPKRLLDLWSFDNENAVYIERRKQDTYIHRDYFKAIAKFHRIYIAKKEAEQHYNLQQGTIAKWVHAKLLNPAIQRPYRAKIIHFYRKTDIEQLLATTADNKE